MINRNRLAAFLVLEKDGLVYKCTPSENILFRYKDVFEKASTAYDFPQCVMDELRDAIASKTC